MSVTRTGERPHVALAIRSLHDTSGGAERVLVDVANGLYRRGYRVSVITYQDKNGPPFYPLDFGIARYDGRSRHSQRRRAPTLETLKSATKRHPLVGAGLWTLQYSPTIYRLRQLLREIQPDVAIGFIPSMFPYLTLAAKTTRTRVIASVHNVPEREFGNDPNRWDQNPVDIAVRKASLRLADATTVLLPSFVDQLPEPIRAKTYVVPNMTRGFGNLRADVRTSRRKNIILSVGRLAHAKDHETLIRAWARLEKSYPTWRVQIIGDGPLRRELRQLITDLGLERVSIDAPRSEIGEAYASARFFVLPSIHEGFGLVTVEALSCGLPVIGFADCEGTNEIVVPGQNGILVDPRHGRDRALSIAMADLIEERQLRLDLAARAPETIGRFSEDAVLDRWERLIDDVHTGRVAGGVS